MIAFLISLAPFIPVMLQIAGFFIEMFGTSKANLEAYQSMIQKNKDSGLITVETAEKLSDWHKQMMAYHDRREAAKKAAEQLKQSK